MLKMNGVVRLVALPLAWSCSLLASELCCTWPFQSSDFPFINQHLSWHQGCIFFNKIFSAEDNIHPLCPGDLW